MKRARRKDSGFIYNDYGLTSGTNEWRVNYNGEIYTPTYLLDSLEILLKYGSISAVGEPLNDIQAVVNYDVRSKNPQYMVYL